MALTSKISDFRGCVALVYSGDPDFLNYYGSIFVSLGFTPVTATTPDAAAGMLRLTTVALVMVDQGETLQECREVIHRANETRYHASVVVACRMLSCNSRRDVTALKAMDLLQHPAKREDMVRALEKIPSPLK